jgi:hypothetical protein
VFDRMTAFQRKADMARVIKSVGLSRKYAFGIQWDVSQEWDTISY